MKKKNSVEKVFDMLMKLVRESVRRDKLALN